MARKLPWLSGTKASNLNARGNTRHLQHSKLSTSDNESNRDQADLPSARFKARAGEFHTTSSIAATISLTSPTARNLSSSPPPPPPETEYVLHPSALHSFTSFQG